MGRGEQFGFIKLVMKSLTVLTASIGTLFGKESKAIPEVDFKKIAEIKDYNSFQNIILKSRLVLKKNPYNSESFLLAQHVSHSSHASHASHSSHSSHLSSSNPPPTYIPPESTPSPTTYVLGSRVLEKGMNGDDVSELQRLLKNLGYNIESSGYYGDHTVDIVKQFQSDNELIISGKANYTTIKLLKEK
jgi:hypothetical protein